MPDQGKVETERSEKKEKKRPAGKRGEFEQEWRESETKEGRHGVAERAFA